MIVRRAPSFVMSAVSVKKEAGQMNPTLSGSVTESMGNTGGIKCIRSRGASAARLHSERYSVKRT